MSTTPVACARCGSALEWDDLRCTICNHAAPPTSEDEPEAQLEVLRCTSCGAAMSYAVEYGAPACAFCGAVLRLELPSDPIEQARRFLPFTVDRAAAEAALRRWLVGLGWFRPSDLVSASRLESLRALRWVGWVFDARALVSWAADSDHGARKAKWAPHAGQLALEFDDVVVPVSRGLRVAETAALVPSYDVASAVPSQGEDESDVVVERFDLRRSAARRTIVSVIEGMARGRLERGVIPGRRFRNLHVAILLRRLTTRRCAFPAYVLAYRYRGRLYRFVLSGQDPTCLLGQAPYSVARISAAVLGGGALVALLALLLAVLI